MKKIIYILILAITATSFISCKKSGVDLFVGNYSFKTTGEVSITAQAVTDSSSTVIPAVLNADLSNDVGQLDICVSDKESNEVIAIFNYMDGDLVTTYGTCHDDIIELDPFQRNTLPLSINPMLSTSSTYVTIKGTGQLYDDIIVFDMSITGRITINTVTFKIKDKNVQMVAYRN